LSLVLAVLGLLSYCAAVLAGKWLDVFGLSRVAIGITLALFLGATTVAVIVWVRGRRYPTRRVGVLAVVALAMGCTFWLISGLGTGGVMLIQWAERGRDKHFRCRENIDYLLMAMRSCMESEDARYPEAEGWCDTLAPALARITGMPNLFVCPLEPELSCGYAYNAALSGLMYSSVANPASTIVIFESDAGWNAAGGPELLPHTPRHYKRDWYGFADGHVEYLPRKRLPDGTWAKEPDANWVIWEPVVEAYSPVSSPLP
jgi:hypothetical protein